MNVPRSCTRRRPRRRDRLATLTLPTLLLLCVGCPFSPQDTTSSDVTDSTATVLDGNANASLTTATPLGLSSGNQAIEFRGSITSNADIDVYNLGTLSEGDRLFVDVQRTTKNLDPTAAIFDSREYMVAFNDDRAQDGTDLDPMLDFVVRGDTDTYYLAVIAYPGNFTTGDYSVALRIERAIGNPGPQIQLVYLNWAGGENVLIENVGLFNLPPFNATHVGPGGRPD